MCFHAYSVTANEVFQQFFFLKYQNNTIFMFSKCIEFDRICLTPNFQIEDTCLQELMSSQIETLLLSKEVLCRDCIGLEWTCQKVQNSCSFSSRLVRTKKVIAITVCVKF